LSENEAIEKLKKGYPEAFEALYKMHHGKLYNYMLKLAKGNADTAAEIVQTVFVKLWDMRSEINVDKNLFNFLYVISKNILLNNYSHLIIRQAYNKYILESEQTNTCFTELDVDKNLLDQLVNKLVGRLPPARKRIFIMSRHEGKSYKEIAQALEISESTVENQIGKALAFLRHNLKKYYNDDFFL